MTSRTYSIKIPSQTDNLELIRDFVYKIAAKNGINDEIAESIELAVDEACTNVIKHAYNLKDKEQLRIRITVTKNKIAVSIMDHGESFDPNSFKIHDISERVTNRKKSGYGMFLMRNLMDEVDFDIRPGNKNEVVLTKHLK